MLSPLSVCEVGAIVLVDCKAEAAFEAANVILEEIGVLVWAGNISPDTLVDEGVISKDVPRSIVSSASFRKRSRLSAFVADCDATPPPPNFDPARFCMSAMMRCGSVVRW